LTTTQVAFRIAAPEYAQSPEQMLSGEGAFLYGGRWNNPGTRLVYLAQSLSLAAFEQLVHLQRSKVLATFRVLRVDIPEECILDLDPADLPADWNSLTGSSGTRLIGDTWAASRASLALRVPSIVIPGEHNYLLNPVHEDMGRLTAGEILPFNYDQRVMK